MQARACAKGVFVATDSLESLGAFFVLKFIVQGSGGLTAHLTWLAMAHVRGSGPRVQLVAGADLRTVSIDSERVVFTSPENGPKQKI